MERQTHKEETTDCGRSLVEHFAKRPEDPKGPKEITQPKEINTLSRRECRPTC
jgi:hypothetical protein